MVFSSYIFLFYFLPIVLAVYYVLPLALAPLGTSPDRFSRVLNFWLLLVSYLFYGWWDPKLIPLMFFITLVNYCCGLFVASEGAHPRQRRIAVTVAVVASLSLLGFFKYFMFLQSNVNVALGWAGVDPWPEWEIILPIGISFYTFHALSYSLDVYRGDAPPARSFIDFACYIALFPQLVAGPIVRYESVADQLVRRRHTVERFGSGTLLFALGLAKKICVANVLSDLADSAFSAQSLTTIDAWFGLLAYAFQIYFDFSGYSDMAIGLGRMFGFEFLENFHSPYHADSITDFWRRWHISLSSFLRDYLYIPLGGNRKGTARTYLNLATVMLLGGLWHGASWTFVIWGAYHGTWLALERWWSEWRRARQNSHPPSPVLSVVLRPLRVLRTFVLILFSWVLFRCETLADAGQYFSWLFGLEKADWLASSLTSAQFYTRGHVTALVFAAVLVAGQTRAMDWSRNLTWPKALAVGPVMALAIAMMFAQSFNPFLYFQF